jgi:alkanesulfonate monooxygenase SsuD/methylene tetrahydromethanopterin reductase-like flavin-dependent oxidoreductase (luciferase family)
MRFGIILNGGSESGQARDVALADMLEKARMAHRHGFQSLWVGPGYLDQGWHATTLLARVAAETPGMELGLIALLPLHHPVELAEQVATLDVISGGKIILAAALGWRGFQFRAFGIPQTQRLSRFLEVLEVMQKLWTQERLTHQGRYFHIDDVPGAGATLQRPHPKILIAANLDAGVVRAARIADGWLVSSRATFATIQQQMHLYRSSLRQNHTGYVAAWREMYVAADKTTAIATIRPHVEWLYRDRAALGHNQSLPEADRIDVPFEQVLEGRFIIGSPEECLAEVRKYQEVGVQELIMRCQWPGMAAADGLRAIQAFGRDVLPRITAS